MAALSSRMCSFMRTAPARFLRSSFPSLSNSINANITNWTCQLMSRASTYSIISSPRRTYASEPPNKYDPPSPYKTPGPRRYGWENKLFGGGLLPRISDKRVGSLPGYKVGDSWNSKRALFGQNDYIDILGDGDIHPVELMSGPKWLIGFRGNELQRLVRRARLDGHRIKYLYPTRYHQMWKRIKFLYKKYNRNRGKRVR